MDGVLRYLYNNLFQCKLCSARFSSKTDLIDHEKTHTHQDAGPPSEEVPEIVPEIVPEVRVKTEVDSDDNEFMVANSDRMVHTNHVAERQASVWPRFDISKMFNGPQASGSTLQENVKDKEHPIENDPNPVNNPNPPDEVNDYENVATKTIKTEPLPDPAYNSNIMESPGSSFAMYLTWQKIAEQTTNSMQPGVVSEFGKIVTRIQNPNEEEERQNIEASNETKDGDDSEIPKETIESVDNYVKEVLTQMGIRNSVEEPTGLKNSAETESPKQAKPPLEKPFKCDVCGHCFAQNYKLTRHYRVHTGERPYKCKLCDASFSQKSILDNHERLHTGEKPFRCELCNAVFSVKGYLIKHYRTHTGEKPFKCNMCDSVFSDRGNLSKHKKIHSGEKPYKCGSCAAAFSDRSTLTKHQRIHTSDKAYKCEYCNASFAMKSALTTHKKLHTTDEQHKCDVCDAEFSQRGYLIRHLRTHTGEKQYIPSFMVAKKEEASSIVTRKLDMEEGKYTEQDFEMEELNHSEQGQSSMSIPQESSVVNT